MSAPTSLVERPAPPEPEPEPGAATRPAVSHRRTLLLALPLTVLVAFVCSSILQAPLWWGHVNPALVLVAGVFKPVDALLVWLVLLLVVALTNRLWLSIGIVVLLATMISVINNAKMSILTEPLFPSDTQFLNTPGFLLSMVSPVQIGLAVLAVPVVLVLFVLFGRRMARRYPRVTWHEDRRLWIWIAVVRLLVVVLVLAALASTTGFNRPGNPWRRLYDAQGAVWLPFSQAMNYRTNGFLGGVLYNMPTDVMRVPQGYSEETMGEVAERYADRAAERNAGLTPGALADTNVVMVLSESYADPSRFEGLELERDPMPLTKQTIATAWGGSALANFYGTGTSSMEFQALTGQTLALFNPQIVAPYQNFMTDLDDYPSAVGWFHEHGHRAIAVHPYTTEMYRRKAIYPMLGFDDFVYAATMNHSAMVEHTHYISDASAFEEVQDQIAESDQPLLVNLVTMQNHVPMSDTYSEPMDVSGDATDDERNEIGNYSRGLEYSDAALDDFLAQLEQSDEDTVVVYYGDHYPGIFGQSLLDKNQGLGQLETPLLIWSNRGQEPRALPLTSANQFMPYVFELAGEPLPPYYELLTEVAEEIGALSPGRIVSPQGLEVSRANLSDEQEQLLHDYELVQYDFSIGERYAVDEMWYQFD